MNDVTPTVMIKTENGPVRINLSDYDKDKHTLVKGDEAAVSTDDFDRKAAMETLEKAGVKFAKNAKDEKLQELLIQLEANKNQKVFEVQPKDDKFIIVDGEGVQVGEDLYDTEDDAKAMVSLLKGE